MSSRALTAVLAAALLALAAQPAEAQQEWSFEGDRLLVTNLAGKITVRGHDGSRIIVRATPGGSDGEKILFEVKREGRAEFHAVYPLGEATRFEYPEFRGRTRFQLRGWLEESNMLRDIYADISGREKIEVGSDVGRDAMEAWADLEVLLPRGVSTRVRLAVGEIDASDVEASLDLDTHSGSIDARNITGDTRMDTGSGSVSATTIRGSLNIDTGSGRVEVSDVQGDDVLIDTGSGGVTVNGASARRLEIDTGSGSVRTERIAAGSTNIDTGSGSVTLDLMSLDDGRHVIDTGSGSVTVRLPADASVRIIAETGSGGITLDVPNAILKRMSRDEIDLQLGDGRARLEIDTGSGGVRIESRG